MSRAGLLALAGAASLCHRLRCFDHAPFTMSMIETIKACLMRNSVDGAVTIALSGGVDSMVLLDVVSRLREASSASPGLSSLSVDALHVHHGLSPNADMWAEFCTAQCATRGVPLKVVRVAIDRQTTEGQGIEGLARARRYEALRAHGAKWTLAGQHADDQAETVLHQLLRGTGLAGLAAMGETREFAPGQWLVRPLLGVTRGDIEAYAAAHQLRWIEDESNADTAYLRNYIRHDLAPLIAARFPHYRASLARAARHAAEAAALNEALAKLDLRWDGAQAFADGLDALDLVRQANALYWWLKWQGVPAPSHAQLEEWARQIFSAAPTDKPHQAGGHQFVIRRRRNLLELLPSTSA
jgi:tRNA(Ile)-lysidine synthase